MAGFVEFLDERDRFFTPNIIKITAYEWGIYIGIAFSGNEIELNFDQNVKIRIKTKRLIQVHFNYLSY